MTGTACTPFHLQSLPRPPGSTVRLEILHLIPLILPVPTEPPIPQRIELVQPPYVHHAPPDLMRCNGGSSVHSKHDCRGLVVSAEIVEVIYGLRGDLTGEVPVERVDGGGVSGVGVADGRGRRWRRERSSRVVRFHDVGWSS